MYHFSEQKRLLKAQKKAEEKAQKAPTVQPTAKKEEAAAGGENDDQDIDPNVGAFIILNKRRMID